MPISNWSRRQIRCSYHSQTIIPIDIINGFANAATSWFPFPTIVLKSTVPWAAQRLWTGLGINCSRICRLTDIIPQISFGRSTRPLAAPVSPFAELAPLFSSPTSSLKFEYDDKHLSLVELSEKADTSNSWASVHLCNRWLRRAHNCTQNFWGISPELQRSSSRYSLGWRSTCPGRHFGCKPRWNSGVAPLTQASPGSVKWTQRRDKQISLLSSALGTPFWNCEPH